MPPKRKIARISQSRPVKFIIGRDKVEYTIHEEAFASLSPALRAMLTNGMMQESLEAKVIWDDVNPDAFEILLRFAYYGDYDESILRQDSKKITAHSKENPALEECDRTSYAEIPEAVEPGNSLYHYIKTASEHVDCSGLDFNSLQMFCMDRFVFVNDHNRYNLWETQLESEGRQTYLEYFMKHIEVYLLADKYHLPGLVQWSYKTMLRALVFSPITSELMNALVDIFPTVDEHTPTIGCLRDSLIDYFICQLDWIKNNGYLHYLVDELDLAKDLLMGIPQNVWKHIREVLDTVKKPLVDSKLGLDVHVI